MSHFRLPALQPILRQEIASGAGEVAQARGVAEVKAATAVAPIDASKAVSGKRVVVIGGGFGGLEAAKKLGNRPGMQVTIIDKNDDFVFQPLLFQVAAGKLKKDDISASIAKQVAQYDNVAFVKGQVDDVDQGNNAITLGDGRKLPYDYLIVAAGVGNGYHGHDEWADVTVGLKTIDDATKMKDRVLARFEQAALEPDPAKRAALLTFVVVGGGPVGLEVSGEMSSVMKKLADSYSTIAANEPKIMLVEGGDRLIGRYGDKSSAHAKSSLEKLGVEVCLGQFVKDITAQDITVGDRVIATNNVFWAGGVKGASVGDKLGAPPDRVGRVVVQDDLTIPGHDNVFVVGDLAKAETKNGDQVPGVAQGAIQGADHACKSILGDLTGKPREKFEFRDMGKMAYLHQGNAVAELPLINLRGGPAWALWLGIHVATLPESLATRATMLGANLFGTNRHLDDGGSTPPPLTAPALAT